MSYKDNVFVDTSAFKALMDERDDFYNEAGMIWQGFLKTKVELLTSNFILDESYTLLRARRNLETVKLLRSFLIDSEIPIKITRVTARDEVEAWKWFVRDWSKLSFTDCVSFAMMKRMGIKKVFSFDQHFARAGFKLVSREERERLDKS